MECLTCCIACGDPVCDSEHEVVVTTVRFASQYVKLLTPADAGRVPGCAGQRLAEQVQGYCLYGTCCHPSVRGCTWRWLVVLFGWLVARWFGFAGVNDVLSCRQGSALWPAV
jgi:hypothetical protein